MKLSAILTHFGMHTYYLDSIPGAIGHWRLRLDKQLWIKLGSGYYALRHEGLFAGLDAPVTALCQALSGHKVFLMVNGKPTKVLDLTTKVVERG